MPHSSAQDRLQTRRPHNHSKERNSPLGALSPPLNPPSADSLLTNPCKWKSSHPTSPASPQPSQAPTSTPPPRHQRPTDQPIDAQIQSLRTHLTNQTHTIHTQTTNTQARIQQLELYARNCLCCVNTIATHSDDRVRKLEHEVDSLRSLVERCIAMNRAVLRAAQEEGLPGADSALYRDADGRLRRDSPLSEASTLARGLVTVPSEASSPFDDVVGKPGGPEGQAGEREFDGKTKTSKRGWRMLFSRFKGGKRSGEGNRFSVLGRGGSLEDLERLFDEEGVIKFERG